MNWNEIVEAIKTFFSQPIVISIGSITYSLLCALVVFSKTSLGKKAIKLLTRKSDDTHSVVKDVKNKVSEIEKLAKEKINDLKQDYEKKLAVAYAQYTELENFVYQVIDKIPNKKVKDVAEQYKATYETRKKELDAVCGSTVDEILKIKEYIDELQKTLQAKIETIDAKLIETTEKVQEVVENGETTEREETIDTNATTQEV